jgi:hypothetical protein
MLATVVLPEGPREMEIEPIPDSPDQLAIVRELAEDPTAASVVAQIPGHDAWTAMACPMGTSHPAFPVGGVPAYLKGVIERLPLAVEEYLAGKAELAPSRIALARYLKILTPECERQLAEMQAAERQASLDEEADRPDPEEELDRQLREREELRLSMIDEERKIDLSTYHGFLDGKLADDVPQIRLDLERLVTLDDVLATPVKALIEHLVSTGCVVQGDPNDGKPILFDPATKTGMRQHDLTKNGIEYAQFLISLRDPKP